VHGIVFYTVAGYLASPLPSQVSLITGLEFGLERFRVFFIAVRCYYYTKTLHVNTNFNLKEKNFLAM
jgi:hypothetical protein